MGFPIRTSPDQRLLASPRGLSQLTTSFIACLRQGIHTYALSSLTTKSTEDTKYKNVLVRAWCTSARLRIRRPFSLLSTPHYLFSNARQHIQLSKNLILRLLTYCKRPEERRQKHWKLTYGDSVLFLILVGLGRIELPTSPLSGVRSSQLSYRPVSAYGWWSWSGSNRRPPECKSGALPAELQPLGFAI